MKPTSRREKQIIIVTPAPSGSQKGNRITAERWAGILRALGNRVQIRQQYGGENADLLIALHARKSAAAVRWFAKAYPQRQIIVALTGTDLYRDLKHSAAARDSLELADRLIVLQPEALKALPARMRSKAVVILQSVELPRGLRKRRPKPAPDRPFRVCVPGHLRTVKDPFRTAMAARLLPADSRIDVFHIGGATTKAMGERARREAARNPRYHWVDEWPHANALRFLAACHVMVLSSKMEGGANVISEAVSLGVPVIASRISGSVGLLGRDYRGFFRVGDTAALAKLLRRVETDPDFYGALYQDCRKLRPLFRPARERQSWRKLVHELS